MHYRLELSGKTATLYLAGTLSADDALTLCDACAALPTSVRALRLDFRAIGSMSAEAIGVVRALLRHWRAHRRGEFRLTTSHLVATFSDVEDTRAPGPCVRTNVATTRALTVTYRPGVGARFVHL